MKEINVRKERRDQIYLEAAGPQPQSDTSDHIPGHLNSQFIAIISYGLAHLTFNFTLGLMNQEPSEENEFREPISREWWTLNGEKN